jgi:hypothetical protein
MCLDNGKEIGKGEVSRRSDRTDIGRSGPSSKALRVKLRPYNAECVND